MSVTARHNGGWCKFALSSHALSIFHHAPGGGHMAKKAEKGKEEAAKAHPAKAGAPAPASPPEAAGKGESVAGYFRKVFEENPKLLKQRSNDELFRRWLEDHPGHEEVPQAVKVGLQN